MTSSQRWVNPCWFITGKTAFSAIYSSATVEQRQLWPAVTQLTNEGLVRIKSASLLVVDCIKAC